MNTIATSEKYFIFSNIANVKLKTAKISIIKKTKNNELDIYNEYS